MYMLLHISSMGGLFCLGTGRYLPLVKVEPLLDVEFFQVVNLSSLDDEVFNASPLASYIRHTQIPGCGIL